MDVKHFLLILIILGVGYWGFSNYSKASELLKYSTQLEAVNDSLLTSTFTLNGKVISLSSINSKRLTEIDELTQQLNKLNLEIQSISNTSVEIKTVYVEGVADTVYISPGHITYTIDKTTKNYSIYGTLKTPSGEYEIKVDQMPFGLEIREVVTPTGRSRVYARIKGRDDLLITDIDFREAPSTNDHNIWAIGPGVIASDAGIDWGINLRRDKFSITGTTNSVAASWELLRF